MLLSKLEEASFLDQAERSQENVKIFFGFYINAFFSAAASIRVSDGVMVNEYQGVPGFKDWFDKASQNLNVKFPYEFWVKKTRNRVIHLTGSLQDQIRRKVVTRVTMKRREDGSIYAYRDDPPADNRWRFATNFDKKEGGNVIVDRCREYLDAVTQMVNEWENRPPSP